MKFLILFFDNLLKLLKFNLKENNMKKSTKKFKSPKTNGLTTRQSSILKNTVAFRPTSAPILNTKTKITTPTSTKTEPLKSSEKFNIGKIGVDDYTQFLSASAQIPANILIAREAGNAYLTDVAKKVLQQMKNSINITIDPSQGQIPQINIPNEPINIPSQSEMIATLTGIGAGITAGVAAVMQPVSVLLEVAGLGIYNLGCKLLGKETKEIKPRKIPVRKATIGGAVGGGIGMAVSGGIVGSSFGPAGIAAGVVIGLFTGLASGALGAGGGAYLTNLATAPFRKKA